MSTTETEHFFDACRHFDQAMLVTRNLDGQLLARPMFIARMEPDGDLWFATDLNSEKVAEIHSNPEVCVAMAGNGNYVSISGTAETVHDPSSVDAMWNEAWKVWFPEGKQDPHLVLIKVKAQEGEYWSNKGSNRVRYLFESAKAFFSEQRPEITESMHGHVEL